MRKHIVREATLDDAAGIARVHVETWQTAYRGIVPVAYLDSLDVVDRTARWRGGIANPDGPIWVAEERDVVVGFACAGPSRDTDDDAAPGELYGIYVDAAWWGKGPGPALMEEALAWLRRYEAASLWTLDANARARRFYERCGWHVDGATKDDNSRGLVLREVRYRIGF